MFRETEKFTDDERAKFEEWIQKTYYEDFIPKVAKGRNKDVQYIDSVGQGRVWTGTQGKERALVDEIGGLERAVELAKELANIPKDKGVESSRPSLSADISSGTDEWRSGNAFTDPATAQAALSMLPEDARRALRYMALLERMKNGESMLIMPFELRIK